MHTVYFSVRTPRIFQAWVDQPKKTAEMDTDIPMSTLLVE